MIPNKGIIFYRHRDNNSLKPALGQLKLTIAIDRRLNQIPEDRNHVAVRFRRVTANQDGKSRLLLW